jgi:hypothetical protein
MIISCKGESFAAQSDRLNNKYPKEIAALNKYTYITRTQDRKGDIEITGTWSCSNQEVQKLFSLSLCCKRFQNKLFTCGLPFYIWIYKGTAQY